MRTIRLVLGTLAVIMGVAFAGIGLPASSVSALPVTCTTGITAGVVSSAPVAQADSIPTCTPVVIVHSATPTFTATVATNTPEPTVAPTNTPVPPSPTVTQPSGGAGGVVVRPPNTGSGAASTSGFDALTFAAGAMLIAGGAGTLALAARRRR